MQARNNETGEIYDIDEEYILDVSDYYDEMEEQDMWLLRIFKMIWSSEEEE